VSNWRRDIDGLRAIAVLAVLGFHFFPAWVQGGFVGVDIFFVISGYLVTRILQANDASTLTIGAFYARRIRRLFPALVVVLASVLTAACACFYAEEVVELGFHVAASAAFAANLQLWHESGYFDAVIESKPLAHLWSLGVEEQFYMAWPLLLSALGRRRRPFTWMAVLFAGSLAAGVAAVQFDQPTAFYLPFFRFWELIAGAMLALAERRGLTRLSPFQSHLASIAGFGLLVVALFSIRATLPFPGWWALLPVSAAVLILLAGPAAAPNRILLSGRLMVIVGLVSYPLYLWHWPLLVFPRIVFNAEPRLEGRVLLLLAAFALAWLTWRFIERPVRDAGNRRRSTLALAGVMAGVGLAGLVLAGSAAAFPPAPQLVADGPGIFFAANRLLAPDCRLAREQERSLVRRCVRDARGAERFALVGDSKAEALYSGLVRTSGPEGRWLFVGGSTQDSSVVPVLTDVPRYRRYQAATRLALDTVVNNPRVEVVLIASATRAIFQQKLEELPSSTNGEIVRAGLRRFIGELLVAGKKIVLLVDNPTLPDPGRCLVRARVIPPQPLEAWFSADSHPECEVQLARHLELSSRYRALLQDVRQLAPQRISIFDPTSLLCDTERGICGPQDGGGALYSYTDHISGYAALKVGAALNRTLATQLP
jgi:peptidoglycan/LPS O-acetylase OafA/YrhL